ncbi:MAG: hypothetical protein HKN49_07750, partial [Gammaproteobacteria bacterium]|nr:hypothetical protein [Gammaproteobacteria bacterium]
DLRLAEIFSHHPQYFPAFFSCNVAMGTDKWCNRCHKCAFTYLALYPFMQLTDLDAIFGERLFEVTDIRRQVIELATAKIKPWECVGTVEESQLALAITLRKSPQMNFAEAPRRADLERACAGLDIDAACSNTLGTFLGPHNLPDFLEGKVQNYSEQLLTTTLQRDPELWPASLRQRALAA